MHNFYRYKFIPQNYLAEEILLGIILIYPEVTNRTQNLIQKDIFFIENHKIIYSKLIDKLSKTNDDILNLLYELETTNLANKLGGIKYMIQLMKKSQIFISCCKTNNYIENLVKLLKKTYIKRLIVQLGYNFIQLGHVINIENNYLYTKILSYINNIEKEINYYKKNHITNIKEFISQKILGVKNVNTTSYSISFEKKITSGLYSLDLIIQSFPIGNLIIIAGRPSIGKTSLAINIAYNCFFNKQINLLIFSLEMTSNQIFNKFINIGSNINIERESIKTTNSKSWEKVSKICGKLLQQNIYINEKPNLEVNQIEFIAKTLTKHQFIQLIIIDYLQLIELPKEIKTNQNRSQEVGHITRRLKLLAQYLKVPIIAISQLNRNIENRQNKEPLLSDLKESGCIIYCNNINTKQKILNSNVMKKNIISLNQICMKKTSKLDRIKIISKKIFKHFTKMKSIGLTHNHKFLYKNTWIISKQILKTTNIFNNINRRKKSMIVKKNLNKIKFYEYYQTYDININNYFNFITENIIIHNSIEQDADIIMILYTINNSQNNSIVTHNQTIDLKVSKNRNGNTGYCKLNFDPCNNIFRDISEN